MSKNKIVTILITAVTLGIFLYIIQPGGFNIIPFLIHQNYFRGFIKESSFIYLFDILFCLVLLLVVYTIYKSISKKSY